jgi:hypothetical protein
VNVYVEKYGGALGFWGEKSGFLPAKAGDLAYYIIIGFIVALLGINK